MKFVALIALYITALALPHDAQSTSLDCAKASSKVEHLVCGSKSLSKFDEELGRLYQDVLSRANAEQNKTLVAEQKHWLSYTRNSCKDEPCLKLAYWSRQAALAAYFEPKSPLYEHESDKASAIQQVLATSPLYPMSPSADTSFCRQIFDDLKQMKGIRFVDPVVQTLSYEAPALDPWTNSCKGKSPLHFRYGCDPNISGGIRDYRDVLDTPGCHKGFGLPPFKIYEIPVVGIAGKTQRIFYADDAYGGQAWDKEELLYLLNDPRESVWESKKPKLGGYSAGFQSIDIEKCTFSKDGSGIDAAKGGRNGENYNSIVEYKNQYYFLILNRHITMIPGWEPRPYNLDIESVIPYSSKNTKFCHWTHVAPESNFINQGSK